MEALARQWRHSREQVAVVEGVLTVDDCALSHSRPAPPEVGDESVSHLVAKEKLEGLLFQRLQERSKAPFLNASCLSLLPCAG